jgi:hypothetical protein
MSMGVYIDMEMPPDGRYTVCVTHDSDSVVHWVFQNQDTLEFLKHGTVTEVPEPHGRLILADELIEFIENRYEITWKDDYKGGIKDACVDILEKISTMPRYSSSESKERPAFLPQYELTPRSEEG